jgi:hypothetical protein
MQIAKFYSRQGMDQEPDPYEDDLKSCIRIRKNIDRICNTCGGTYCIVYMNCIYSTL